MNDRTSEASISYSTELTKSDGSKIKKSILLDKDAVSIDPKHPPFVSPPEGSKPYYGFRLIEDLCVDGYCYGAVTDFLEPDSDQGCTIGDGFVEAPDGRRAGLVWEVSDDLGYFRLEEPDDVRWGVYYFTVPNPIQSLEDMKRAFEGMLPVLKRLHEGASSS